MLFDRISDALEPYRNFDWFDSYSRWMLKVLPGTNSAHLSSILILLFPFMLLVLQVQIWFDSRPIIVLDFIFKLVIFSFCIGPLDLNRQINRYLDAKEKGDEAAANREAQIIMSHENPTNDQQVRGVMRAILHEANDRFFAVIFWFVLLGPFGAILYRLTSHVMYANLNAPITHSAKHFQAILAWAPAHAVAIGYALTGNYEGAKQEFYNKNKQSDLSDCNFHTLITAGLGALKNCQAGEEVSCVRSTRALVLRTLVAWLGIIAILTLLGWSA